MNNINWRIGILLYLMVSSIAFAQAPNPTLKVVSQTKDLEFPNEPSSISNFTNPRMALFKPDGAGPFPAIVLHHQCSGIGDANRPNVSMINWAKETVGRGYVVLLMDSLSSRGAKTLCMGPQNGVTFARGARDAFQAAEHLRKFDFVDKKRVALAGYSWGAMVAVFASSKQYAANLSPGERFATAVAFYPGCFTLNPPSGKPYEIVNPDIDRPLLALMGAKDTETPAEECVAKMTPVKASGAPIDWHVYPDATHCWDCSHLNNFSKTDSRGVAVTYKYDKAVTQDASRRMFEFLSKTMGN